MRARVSGNFGWGDLLPAWAMSALCFGAGAVWVLERSASASVLAVSVAALVVLAGFGELLQAGPVPLLRLSRRLFLLLVVSVAALVLGYMGALFSSEACGSAWCQIAVWEAVLLGAVLVMPLAMMVMVVTALVAMGRRGELGRLVKT